MNGPRQGSPRGREHPLGEERPLGGAPPLERPRRRGLVRLLAVDALALSLVAALLALGTWQVHRRAWKLDLIAQVEANAHGAPAAAPGPAAWPEIGPRDAYRNLRLSGRYLAGRDTLVQAVTERGGGYWVLTPLRSEAGFLVLVNRGFVPERQAPAAPAGPVALTGLLRLSEPGGGFLRANDPAGGRWYSRDVAAISGARGLAGGGEPVAPYFVDAARGPAGETPEGGLTVIRFRNDHLVYALTWFALALMVAGGTVYLNWDAWRRGR